MRSFETPFRIVLIGISALVVWKGIELSRFALVKQQTDAVITSPLRQDQALGRTQDKLKLAQEATELEPILTNWHDIVGVRSEAVLASVAIKRLLSPTNFRELEGQAKSVLEVRPMSAQAWNLLAGTRLLGGQPLTQAASALQTGLMLAPNEDDLMAERLIYGLLIWDDLMPSAKERIATDLAQVGQLGSAGQISNIRTIVASKDPAARKDLRDRLERSPDRKAIADKVGL